MNCPAGLQENKHIPYCLCRLPDDGDLMIRYDVYFELYHSRCINLKPTQAQRLKVYKYPRWESVLRLLLSLCLFTIASAGFRQIKTTKGHTPSVGHDLSEGCEFPCFHCPILFCMFLATF